MKKVFWILCLFLFFVLGLFNLWQYNLYQRLSETDMSCGGDWSYNVQCPIGSYCRSLGQGPLAGGLCKPILSPLFDIFSKPRLVEEKGESLPPKKQTDKNSLVLEVSGYGYTMGDIVQIRVTQPTLGNIVIFDPYKNKSMCLGMGPSISLGKIVGLPGDSVLLQSDGLKIRMEMIKFDRDYSQQKAVFGGQKYKNLSTNITLKHGEYLLDKWVGLECFSGELDETGSSIPYNRFTVNEEAISGVVEKRIGHDNQAEKEFKNRIY